MSTVTRTKVMALNRALAREFLDVYQDQQITTRTPARDASVRRCRELVAQGATMAGIHLRCGGVNDADTLGVITLRGDADLMEALITAGCDPLARRQPIARGHQEGDSALMTAIHYRQPACVDVLLRHGSDPRVSYRLPPGEPLRAYARARSQGWLGEAAVPSREDGVLLALLRAGADLAEADPADTHPWLWSGVAQAASRVQRFPAEHSDRTTLAGALVTLLCCTHSRAVDAAGWLADLGVDQSLSGEG